VTERIHRGWIPTITGNLSFSIIATGRNPRKRFRAYRNQTDLKMSVVVQRRMTSDAPWLYDYWNRLERRFDFVFLGSCSSEDEYDTTSGFVFVVNKSDSWRFRELFENIERSSNENVFRSEFLRAIDVLRDRSDVRQVLGAHVKFKRDGLVEIRTDENTDADAKVLAAQIYYFLRDITHAHQHHELTSDTILKIYDFSNDSAADRIKWKRETLYALYRWVIQQKRVRKLEAAIRCKGVLAYEESFSKLHIDRRSNQEDRELPKYNRQATIASLNALISELKRKIVKTQVERFFTRSVPLLTVVFAAFAYYETTRACFFCSKSYQSRLLVGILQWLSDNAIYFIVFCAISGLGGSQYSSVKNRVFRWKWFRFFQRLIFSLNFYVVTLLLLGICMLFGVAFASAVFALIDKLVW